ncbi:putative cysteine synthase 2-like [Capsicum annuum]|nr:putative cysteine synthase 2-like [Capsicum annuum]
MRGKDRWDFTKVIPPRFTIVHCVHIEVDYTEGYVIPSLELEGSGEKNNSNFVEVEESKTSATEKEEKIYLGPHGAPPQLKQQEVNSTNSRKQKFRQKLKEADRKYSGSGRENKVEHLRELVGGKMAVASKNSPKDWLDSHCDENMFQRNHR